MTRRILAITVPLVLLLAPVTGDTQQAGKVHRIGYLSASPSSISVPFVEAFREGLRALGYVEGRNIAIEFRWGEGKMERLPGLARELVNLNLDLIVAVATPGTAAAKQATTTIPIVMVGVGDPVALGYVASLARPAGNVTGLSSLSVDLGPKRLELLQESPACDQPLQGVRGGRRPHGLRDEPGRPLPACRDIR